MSFTKYLSSKQVPKQEFLSISVKMNKFTLVCLIIAIAVVSAEPPRPRKPFRSLPARFQSRFLGRQEAAPANGNGYQYPKPDYGLPSEPELPTTDPEPEFVTAEAEAGGDPDVDPNITNESDVNERLRALKKAPRIVYLGLPEHQVHFDDVVYDSDFYPYDLTHAHYYEPYVSSVEVVSIPQPRLKSFSSQYVNRLF